VVDAPAVVGGAGVGGGAVVGAVAVVVGSVVVVVEVVLEVVGRVVVVLELVVDTCVGARGVAQAMAPAATATIASRLTARMPSVWPGRRGEDDRTAGVAHDLQPVASGRPGQDPQAPGARHLPNGSAAQVSAGGRPGVP
jgi:hypothetical protein